MVGGHRLNGVGITKEGILDPVHFRKNAANAENTKTTTKKRNDHKAQIRANGIVKNTVEMGDNTL